MSTDNVGTDPRLWGIGESGFRVWYRVCGGATPNTFLNFGAASAKAIRNGRGVPTFSILAARRTFSAFSCISNSDFIRSSWAVKGLVYSAYELLRRLRIRNFFRVSDSSTSGLVGGSDGGD